MNTTASVLKKVRLLELKLQRRVRDLFAGGYKSAFKGQGVVFSDYRKYIPGDDVRAINWPLTAKTGDTYIKVFEEEKGATFMIAVDISGSFDFGTRSFKGEKACELAALIALSTQRNQDRVGLLLFSDRVEHYVPPSQGLKNTLRIVRDLYSFQRKSVQTDLIPTLDFLNGLFKKRCHIFLFSDFLTNLNFVHKLKIMSRRHDIMAGVFVDPFENQFPNLGLIELMDSETGEQMLVNTSSSRFVNHHKKIMKKKRTQVENCLIQSQVDYFYIHTDKDIFKQILSFFKTRRQK